MDTTQINELSIPTSSQQLQKPNLELSIEKAIMVHAAVGILAGLTLGRTVNKRFYLMPAAIGGFLMQYALTGWSPPFQVFKIFGFRTEREMERESFQNSDSESEQNPIKVLH